MATLFQGKDHAIIYSQIRQSTPADLVNRVLNFLQEKYTGQLELAVDVGCGSGQNTFVYADAFKKVIGIDVSAAQIEAASSKNDKGNVSFEVREAHDIPAEDGSVQLITACAAAHWFDLPKFFAEGQRVLCNGGVMALYCYEMFPRLIWQGDDNKDKSNQIDAVINQLYYETLGEYWEWEKVQLVIDSYKNVIIPMGDFTRECNFLNHYTMSLQDVSARIRSSSAFQSYCKLNGNDKAAELIRKVEKYLCKILGQDYTSVSPESILFNAEDSLFVVMARN